MSIDRLLVEDFRNLQGVDLELGPRFNLFIGRNGAGKTAVLESAFYLGRARSFRPGVISDLVRHGAAGFLLEGSVSSEGGAPRRIRIAKSRTGEGLLQLEGQSVSRVAALTALAPTQVVTGSVAELIEGAPGRRRGWLDWLLFHVEPGFPEQFRRLQVALRQRSAALRGIRERRMPESLLDPWDREISDLGHRIRDARDRRLKQVASVLGEAFGELGLEFSVELELMPGWRRERSLAEELVQRRPRDLQLTQTTIGPHRADVVIRSSAGLGRREFSRGQGKLVAMAMILAGFDVLRAERSVVGTLLLDEVASDLDRNSLRAVLMAIEARPIQVLASAVETPTEGSFRKPENHVTFHVERGRVQRG